MTAAPARRPGRMRAPLNQFVHARELPDAARGAAGRTGGRAAQLGMARPRPRAGGARGARDARPLLRALAGRPVDERVRVGRRAHDRQRRRHLRDRRPAVERRGAHAGRHAADRRADADRPDRGLTQVDGDDGCAGRARRAGRLPAAPGGRRPAPAATAAPRARADRTPPVEQVERMDARTFFTELARLMRDNPPRLEDRPIVERMRRLGLLLEGDDDWARLGATLRPAVEQRRAARARARRGGGRVAARRARRRLAHPLPARGVRDGLPRAAPAPRAPASRRARRRTSSRRSSSTTPTAGR